LATDWGVKIIEESATLRTTKRLTGNNLIALVWEFQIIEFSKLRLGKISQAESYSMILFITDPHVVLGVSKFVEY
jgi:hypothetical protein